MHNPYTVQQEDRIVKWIKKGKTAAEISRKMKARFANLDPSRTNDQYMRKIHLLTKKHAPGKIKPQYRTTQNTEFLYRKGMNLAMAQNNSPDRLGPRAYAALSPEEQARITRKWMIEWIRAYRIRQAQPPKPDKIKPPWTIPGMGRKTIGRTMQQWRGVNRHDGVASINNAVGRISREPGFYVVRYDPYDLIKVGMSKDVHQRLRGYIASSNAKAHLVHLRRFEKNNDIKGERFASRAARYEASFLYQLSERGVKPAYGDEWFRKKNYPKVRSVLSTMNKWTPQEWNLLTMISTNNKHGRGIQKFGKLVGRSGTNWNLKQGNFTE
jgi:hypothetical protein